MKSWYQNRMEAGVNHRGFNVSKDKYLYLTDAQAEVHNKDKQQRVAKVDTPPKKEQVAVIADWEEFENLQKATNNDPANTRAKSSTKPKN